MVQTLIIIYLMLLMMIVITDSGGKNYVIKTNAGKTRFLRPGSRWDSIKMYLKYVR
jgi:hypothetical protein